MTNTCYDDKSQQHTYPVTWVTMEYDK